MHLRQLGAQNDRHLPQVQVQTQNHRRGDVLRAQAAEMVNKGMA